ncbi:MAG TPA: tetratricopeptide repeat protein [Verrucomicrobiae bacterium]|nr:tetratricopeptide repeat protein [Verrucomicrobiae bacterium]
MIRPRCAGGTNLDEIPATTVAASQSSRCRPWLLALSLVVLTFVAYQPVWHAGFVWDDDDYVTNNATLRTGDGLRRIWFEPGATSQYYPLTHTSFWIEYHLWRLNPRGYHVVNVSLHVLNAILVWLVLRRLQVTGAWLAAAIFALHPVHAESVAWVTERKNLLSGFCYLSALLAYLHWLGERAAGPDPGDPDQRGASAANSRKPWMLYGLALVLYLCALFSKSVTCSLPLAILLLVWWKRGRLGWRDALPLLPFVALGMAMGLTTLRVEGQHWPLSVTERCLIAGRDLWFYVGKLVWPQKLTFVYPRWQIDRGPWWQYLYPATALGVIATLWALRGRWGRGPVVASLLFVVSLAPALGFFNVYYFRFSFVADHFDYLASVALFALAAAGVMTVAQPGTIRVTTASAVLVTLAALTWHRATAFRSNQELWEDTLRKNPEAFIAHNNLGTILREQGQPAEAVAHWREASRLDPQAWEPHMNLAKLFLDTDKYEQAIAEFREAHRLNPRSVDPRYGLGMAWAKLSRYHEAQTEFEEAVRAKPDDGKAQFWLGAIEDHQGHSDEAIRHYLLAIRYEPTLADAYVDLGLLRQKRGELDRAINCFHTAIRLRPDDARARAALAEVEKQRDNRQP